MTAGRPRFGSSRRVRMCISVDPATAAAIDRERGPLSAGQFVDRLVAAELLRDRPRDDYSKLDE